MTLTDAGPLIALIDAGEADHPLCVEALRHLSLPLVTTWPAFTEAMYPLSRAGGPVGRQRCGAWSSPAAWSWPTSTAPTSNAAPR